MTHSHHVVCPSCRSRNDFVTGVNTQHRPSDGDVGLCCTCGEALIFDHKADSGARQPTPQEHAEFAADVRLFMMRQAWKQDER